MTRVFIKNAQGDTIELDDLYWFEENHVRDLNEFLTDGNTLIIEVEDKCRFQLGNNRCSFESLRRNA